MDPTNAKAGRRTVLHPSVRTLRLVFLTKRDARGRCYLTRGHCEWLVSEHQHPQAVESASVRSLLM